MKTEDAFKELINTRGIHKLLGKTSGAIRMLRLRADKNQVSLDTMEELLQIGGYTKIPATWKKQNKLSVLLS